MRKLKHQVWPYQTRVKHDTTALVDLWCAQSIGRRFVDWFSYDSEGTRIYAFKDEATLLVFKLKWSYNG